ncbi:DnaD domain protein [Brevibacillus choshinensis]|uniref:DnaD domain protein n=1 Tax=Brevibacillus choshinensis TaxID=54911 RepID=A0ABX7FT99_BRECH|nr:DnaD domain protein [Brevibacillus choshinensis]QRG68571.1 DnaD domain protein [Brevibacillus choshinensis]
MRRPEVLERIRPIGGIPKVGQLGFIMMQVLELRFLEMNQQWTFDMTNDELMFLTGIKHRDTLNETRNRLVQFGILKSYKTQKGKAGGIYCLNEFYFPKLSEDHAYETDKLADNSEKNAYETDELTDRFPDRFPDKFTDRLADNRVSSMTERKIDRQIDRQIENDAPDTWNQICDLWQSMFRVMSAMDRERLSSYQDDDGMAPEVILAAVEHAKQDATDSPKNYLWKTLNSWADANIKTVRDLIVHERERTQKKVIPLHGVENGGVMSGGNQQRPSRMAAGTRQVQAPPSAADFLRKRDQAKANV